jgi:hypothetical protein
VKTTGFRSVVPAPRWARHAPLPPDNAAQRAPCARGSRVVPTVARAPERPTQRNPRSTLSTAFASKPVPRRVACRSGAYVNFGAEPVAARLCATLREAAESEEAPCFYDALVSYSRSSIPLGDGTRHGATGWAKRWSGDGKSSTTVGPSRSKSPPTGGRTRRAYSDADRGERAQPQAELACFAVHPRQLLEGFRQLLEGLLDGLGEDPEAQASRSRLLPCGFGRQREGVGPRNQCVALGDATVEAKASWAGAHGQRQRSAADR